MSKGAPKDKLVIGMPLYARGFRLANMQEKGLGATTVSASTAGTYTAEAGFLAYYEVMFRFALKIRDKTWRDQNRFMKL